MNENSIFLTSSGLKNIYSENDFNFFVNDKLYKCSRIFADFISPKISKIHAIDSVNNEYVINCPFDGDFSEILNIFEGKPLVINDQNYNFIRFISHELSNEDLIDYFNKNSQTINLNNVVDMIRTKQIENQNYDQEIYYITSNFFQIDENKLTNLTYEDLQTILTSKSLRIQNEDSLFDYIRSFCRKDNSFIGLFEYIEFSNLSEEKMKEFIHFFDLNSINQGIWNALSKRLILNQNQLIENRYKAKPISIQYDSQYPLNGIFTYMKNKYTSSFHDEVFIHFSNSQTSNPTSIIDHIDQTVFQTTDSPNSWIAFSFKNYKIKLTSYTLMSYYLGRPNFANPKTWIIEGSNNGRNWSTIDEVKDCNSLNGKGLVKNFTPSIVSDKNDSDDDIDQQFSIIRIRQTGKNWAGANQLTLSQVEFFGDMYKSTNSQI